MTSASNLIPALLGEPKCSTSTRQQPQMTFLALQKLHRVYVLYNRTGKMVVICVHVE